MNGVIVACLPSIAAGLIALLASPDNPPVRPPDWSRWPGAIRFFFTSVALMSPFALAAAWRTWTHARRWGAGRRGWQGIAEAGACGLGAALLVLLPATIARPLQSPPYLVVYGGLGLIVGLVLGLLLLLTATIVLTLAPQTPDRTQPVD